MVQLSNREVAQDRIFWLAVGCRTRDIAKGKDRSEDEKYEAKATRFNRFLNHEQYRSKIQSIDEKDNKTMRLEWAL